jgi:hypothetical protein
MAAIAYLNGGERPTADLMNQIFAAFDAKMATMLTNKSFFLSQNAAMTQKFCGRAFFFTIGKGVYATRVPGWVDSGGSVTRPYNHADFTSAVAGINPALVTWDETNKIATVPAFLTSQYNGLTTYMNTTSHVPVGMACWIGRCKRIICCTRAYRIRCPCRITFWKPAPARAPPWPRWRRRRNTTLDWRN